MRALDGRAHDTVEAVFEDRDGNLWIGSTRGLERIRDGVFTTYTATEGLPAATQGPVYTDDDDRSWVAPATGGLTGSGAARSNASPPAVSAPMSSTRLPGAPTRSGSAASAAA